MNPELNPEFDEVLLTAYLDDEVTDEERVLVEQQLRTSESSRKVLEELRSVRNLVVQLHLTQPNRSFQQGPWNDKNETATSSKVVLNDHRSGWNKSFQRLASLAALIAIAACLSVLMFGPKPENMARTEDAKRKIAPAHAENAAQDSLIDSFAFEPASPFVGSEHGQPMAKSSAVKVEPKADAKQEPFARSALSSGAGVNGAGGFGSSAPAKPMAKQKADSAVPERVDPAPAAARMLAESDAGGTVLGIATDPAPAAKPTPSELYFLLPLIQQQADGDWLAVDGRKEAEPIADKEDRDLAVREEAETSTKISPSTARYTYRFRGTVSDQDKASFDKLKIAEKPSAGVAANELSLGANIKTIADAADPLVVELQIPAGEWELGSERLRQLGFDVPVELPQTEYLDFITIQNPKDAAGQSSSTNTAMNAPGTNEKKANATFALGGQFRRVDLSRNELNAKEANVRNAGSKDELEGIEPEGRTRIRVRVMKKE